MHKSKLAGFIIDCKTDDLQSAATFWSAALGMETRELPGQEGKNYVKLVDPEAYLDIEVQQVGHESRVHLDIEADDVDHAIQLVADTPCARAGGAVELRLITQLNQGPSVVG